MFASTAAAAALRDGGPSGQDHPVQIATVGSLDSRVLAAMGLVALQPDRADGLLTLIGRAPLFIHQHNAIEEIGA